MLKISISNQSSFYKAEIVNKMVYNFYIDHGQTTKNLNLNKYG